VTCGHGYQLLVIGGKALGARVSPPAAGQVDRLPQGKRLNYAAVVDGSLRPSGTLHCTDRVHR
jgi:hypothetical protein